MAKVEDITLSHQGCTSKQSYVSPTSLIFQIWEGCIALTCLLTTIFITFQFAFKENTPQLSIFIYISDVFYLVHIIVKFHLAFFSHGALVTDRKRIKNKYVKREFGFDLLSMIAIALEIICLTQKSSNNISDFEKVTRILSLLRVLRFYSLTSYFG